jgi:exonuclease VII small subunit
VDERLVEVDAELAEIDQRAEALEQVAAELQKAQQFIRQRAKEIAQAERQIIAITEGLKASSFGDGTYEVGVDIQPGKYKTKGSAGEASCHWEFRNSRGKSTRNDLGRGPQVLIIPENVFAVVSRECGTWVRVGDSHEGRHALLA